ncbi:hypothetical protein ABIE33_006418 [Ensifer sp. 4252]
MATVTDMASVWFAHYLTLPASGRMPAPARTPPAQHIPTVAIIRAAAESLPSLDDPDFATAFDRFANARVVLLGEASHGTSEFYRARAAITRRLIEQHGFTIVAVEADWPDAATIDRHVRRRPHQPTNSTPFSRFPTWMWRNKDVDAFVSFLRNPCRRKWPPARMKPILSACNVIQIDQKYEFSLAPKLDYRAFDVFAIALARD